MTARREILNIADIPIRTFHSGPRFEAALGDIDGALGTTQLGATRHVVPAGKTAWPFHRHHGNDEIFFVVAGEGTYRLGDKSYPIKAGSVLGAPAGGHDTAHQIINTGSGPLRYYAISTMSLADVCEYPDSGKFGVFSRHTRNPYDHSTIRHIDRAGTGLDYWDGEPGAQESKNE